MDDERDEDRKTLKRNTEHKKFLEMTKDLEERPIIQELMGKIAPCEVLELGSGSERDTVCMLESGCRVTAVDSDAESREIISRRINQEALGRFNFRHEKFENLNLEKDKYDLVVGLYSLFFCNKTHFSDFFKKIVASLKSGGTFAGIFLGPEDDWIVQGRNVTYQTRTELLELLRRDFVIDEEKPFTEVQYDQYKIDENKKIIYDEKGNPVKKKHWHVYRVVVKKK